MLAKRAFFSFVELTDPTRHHEYNEYHQLDHRPENLALPGVVWGDRWVRSPDCAERSEAAHDDLARIQYVAMYWFADPVEQSVAEWQKLGKMAFQWGRRPDTDWSRRQVGFFLPLKGYVNPRTLVSADALVFRPLRGLYLEVLRAADPAGSATEQAYRYQDRVYVPEVVSRPGVAGAWTFSSEWCTLDRDRPNGLRVNLFYLDEDPGPIAAGLAGSEAHASLTPLLRTPLRPITPWAWDWFDA